MMASLTIKNGCIIRNCFRLSDFKLLTHSLATFQRSYVSALHVPGNKANKTFAYLSPDLNYRSRFEDIQKLQKEIKLRGLSINVEELKKSYDYFEYVSKNKALLENKRDTLLQKIKYIDAKKDASETEKQESDALLAQVKIIRDELKGVKEIYWDLEETFVPQLLKLPNIIDEKTPHGSSIVLKENGKRPQASEVQTSSHLDIGKKLDLIDYKNPTQYFLSNEAAYFELGLLALAGKIMNNAGATRVTSPDFCRSIVIEGCGLDHENPSESFILQNFDDVKEEFLINRIHLVGAASLPALLSMNVKNIITKKDFPFKIFSIGRQYAPFPNSSGTYGLFTACQGSALQALTYTEPNSDMYKLEFENLVNVATEIYDQVGCHYRIVLKSAAELSIAESMKVAFEMWSVHSNKYIEVGHVTAYDNYLSKRLMIGYQKSNGNGLSAIISGSLLSVPRVLGCLIEENADKFVEPEKVTEWIH